MEDDEDMIGQEISTENIESKAISLPQENEEIAVEESKEPIVTQSGRKMVQKSAN